MVRVQVETSNRTVVFNEDDMPIEASDIGAAMAECIWMLNIDEGEEIVLMALLERLKNVGAIESPAHLAKRLSRKLSRCN